MKKLFTLLALVFCLNTQVKAQFHKIKHVRYSSSNLRTGNLSSVMSATCPSSPITMQGYDTLGNIITNGQILNTNAAAFYIYPNQTTGTGFTSPCINTLYTDCYANIGTSGSETFLEGGAPIYTLCPTCSAQIDMGTGVSGIPWGWALYDLNPSQQHQFIFCRDASITTSTVTLTDCWTGAVLASNPSSILFSNATTTVGGTCDTLTLPANTDIGTATYIIAPATGTVGFGGYNDGATLIYPDSLPVGTYTVTYNFTPPASSGCGSVSGSFMFTIAPLITVTVNSATICLGEQTATLTASGATNYTWTPTTGLSSTTGSVVAANPPVTINYTVTGTSSDSMGVATSIVTVNPLPGITTPTITPTNCGQCNGSFTGATGTGGSGTYYYALNGAVYYSYSVPSYSLCAGVYYFAAVDSVTGCYSPTQIYTITTIGSPTVSFTLVADISPHTWDAYPTYSSNVDSARWYWGDSTSTAGLYPSHIYSVAGWYNICVTVTDTAGCTATYCQNDSLYRLANNSPLNTMVYINVKSGAMGIEQVTNNNELNIYPNPNNGLFNFTISQFDNLKMNHIEIYNVTGECVHRQIATSANCQIDLSSLNEGVYSLSLQSNEGVVNKRLVIVR